MRASTLLLVGLLTFGFSRSAAAVDPSGAGAEVALRFGVALPAGYVQGNQHLGDTVNETVPFIFSGGYRFDPSLYLGARLEYAFASVKSVNGSCNSNNASCGGSNYAVGIEGTYRFLPDTVFAPWVGLGGGYEWLSEDVTSNVINASGNATFKGWQLLAQIGGDVRVTPQLVLGPFVEARFGKYGDLSTSLAGPNGTTTTDTSINNTAWHTWVAFGVRGAFGF